MAKTRIGISIPKTHLSSRTAFWFPGSSEKGRGVGLCPVKANSLIETDVLEGRLFCLGDRQGRGVGFVSNLRLLHQAVSIASANTKLFKILALGLRIRPLRRTFWRGSYFASGTDRDAESDSLVTSACCIRLYPSRVRIRSFSRFLPTRRTLMERQPRLGLACG